MKETRKSGTARENQALGVGWALQDAGYFKGESDTHRVASYNPWVALRWMLDGKIVGGAALRGPEETPTRENALRMYTQGSASFAFSEKERGSLEVGKLADLAVLSKDYFKVPVEEIGEIEAVMTVVGGRVMHEKR